MKEEREGGGKNGRGETKGGKNYGREVGKKG